MIIAINKNRKDTLFENKTFGNLKEMSNKYSIRKIYFI